MPKYGESERPKSEGMSPEEILKAFDGLIAIQESRGVIRRE
jgi:hypothetical protein